MTPATHKDIEGLQARVSRLERAWREFDKERTARNAEAQIVQTLKTNREKAITLYLSITSTLAFVVSMLLALGWI